VNHRRFTTVIEQTHKKWLGYVLGMETSTGEGGIDLVDEEFGIELKSRLKTWKHGWAVDARQVDKFPLSYPTQELYWAFLIYGLNKEPSRIREGTKDLSRYVTDREIRFLPWDFIQQFKVTNPRTGPYRHVTRTRFPREDYFIERKIGSNVLFVPRDSNLEKRLSEAVGQKVRVCVRYRGNVKTVTYG